jgi:hypothetical protein
VPATARYYSRSYRQAAAAAAVGCSGVRCHSFSHAPAIYAQPLVCSSGDYIAIKGNAGASMFILRSGLLRVVDADGAIVVPCTALCTRNAFGGAPTREESIIADAPQCDVLELDGPTFMETFAGMPSVMEHVQRELSKFVEPCQTALATRIVRPGSVVAPLCAPDPTTASEPDLDEVIDHSKDLDLERKIPI